MKTLDYNRIEYYKTGEINFDLKKYFNQAVEVYKNNWQKFAVYTFMSTVILFVSYFTLFGSFLIIYPLLMGFLIATEIVDEKKYLKISDFFKGFKSWKKFILFSAIIFFGLLILFLPLFFLSVFELSLRKGNSIISNNVDSILNLYGLAIILVLFIFKLFTFFTPYFILYGNLSVKESIKTSYLITKNNFWKILVVTLLIGLVTFSGAILFYIGALITIPIGYCMTYFLLKDIILKDLKN